MPNYTKTRNIPLRFAEQLTEKVKEEWDNGTFLDKVSYVTQDLLRFWFSPTFVDERDFNFHEGQKQAILNTIYCHEILKTQSVSDMYQKAGHNLVDDEFSQAISSDKFSHSTYCIKMATGTGKTWCMSALLLWQYLNAKFNKNKNGCTFTANFLFVAPGLIVYEPLLDSLLGKENENGIRNFETSDLKRYQELFVPEKYRNAVFSFVQNNVVKKDEIGRKVTGEGIIVTNWHVLMGAEDETEEDSSDINPSRIIKDLLPITPGITAGHSLDSLDNRYLSGKELDYLRSLESICVWFLTRLG